MKVAFLTSFNIDLLKRNCQKYVIDNNINVELWWHNYAQYEQSIYDESSSLYNFKPDIVIIHLEVESLLGDYFYDLLSLSGSEREKLVADIKSKLRSIINKILENFSSCKIILENFISRERSNLGLLDQNISFGISQITLELNQFLIELKSANYERIFINSYDALVSGIGKENWFDMRMQHLAKQPINYNKFDLLVNHYFLIIESFLYPRKKCIITDLDNTLWGGIIGQDGIDNIKLGGSGIGESFVQFQKLLLNFYRQGIFLAICSKNNYDDVLEVLEKHPDMVLRKEYFSSIKINWTDKAQNIFEISDELNIGLDSLIFLDDNPAECELIKQQIAEITTVLLTGDPDNYIKQVKEIKGLQTTLLTKEDIQRNKMFAADMKRKELKTHVTNMKDFYKSLQMVALLEIDKQSNVSRIAQLTQKTNQFNLTTRRYSIEDIRRFISGKDYKVYSLRLEDKFGDNGIVLVAIVKKDKKYWSIDTLLMSCRVIGRQAETALLSEIISDAEKENIEEVIGEYIPTKKNKPAENFYLNHGFSKKDETIWVLKLPSIEYEHQINIKREE